MVAVCFYFQVHQPYRLRKYPVFDIGANSDYFNHEKNREIMLKVADKSQVGTQRIGQRPYGVGLLVAGADAQGPHLYETKPSGVYFEYVGMAIGARSQAGGRTGVEIVPRSSEITRDRPRSPESARAHRRRDRPRSREITRDDARSPDVRRGAPTSRSTSSPSSRSASTS